MTTLSPAPGDRRFLRFAGRCYRLLLLAYPAAFRREYGDEMTRAFRVRIGRARLFGGRWTAARGMVAMFCDLLLAATLERLSTIRRSHSTPTSAIAQGRPPKGDRMLSRLFTDLRYSARTLARQPVSTVAIVLTLAIGSAATISIFSIVDGALLNPLPYPEPERLISLVQESEQFSTYSFSAPFLDDLRSRTESFETIVAFSPSWTMTLTDPGEPRVLEAAYVSDGLLTLLGARPIAGRFFEAAEQVVGGPKVVVVSESFWDRQFGAGTQLSGQTVRLGGEAYDIVGVAPDLRMPITTSVVSRSGSPAELWIPFVNNPFFLARSVPVMNTVGRLRDGATARQAAAELERLHPILQQEYPDAGLGTRFVATPLAELVARESRLTVLLLFAAAFLLLLIACANVANLMLNRSMSRTRDLAIRSSLGASRRRLIEQVLTDSLLIAIVGSGAGLLLAAWTLSAVPALGLVGLPPSAEVHVDARVAGFSMFLVALTAALFGSVPAVYSWRVAALGCLRDSPRVSTGAPRKVRSSLVVVEVALAVTLLVGAGLLARSFLRLTHVDPGFRTEGLITLPLSIADGDLRTATDREAFLTSLLGRLGGLPGVEQVAAINRLPLGGSNVLVGVQKEGQSDTAASLPSDRRVATPGYFDTMEIELLEGRAFESSDDADSDFGAAIVNHTAARLLWPDRPAVGRRLRLMLRGGPGPWLSVVGVVDDVRHHGLDEPPKPEVYVPYAQASVETMVVLLRGPSEQQALLPAIKDAVWGLDHDIPLDGIRGVDAVVAGSVSAPRLRLILLNAFAGLALLLAAIGTFGVISSSVAQRSREIGIRVALGAQRRAVLWMTVREGLVLGATGAALGLVASLAMSRLISDLLFETAPTDPLTLASVGTGLLIVVAAASYLPARRATRVDPVVALRSE